MGGSRKKEITFNPNRNKDYGRLSLAVCPKKKKTEKSYTMVEIQVILVCSVSYLGKIIAL